MTWTTLADRTLAGYEVTADEALAVLRSPDDELLPLLHAAFRLRERHHGREVRIHVLRNAKSGLCPENCAFCSQSVAFHTEAPRYQMQSVEELIEGAREAARMGAVKYCMVTSTRGPSQRELDVVCEAVRRIKSEVNIRICTSLGLLREGQAEQLAAAGVDRFNHNLEASRRFFPEVCTTHGFDDRVRTVERARAAGMERSEEHTSELQSHVNLVCRLLLEKKKNKHENTYLHHHETLEQVHPNPPAYDQLDRSVDAKYRTEAVHDRYSYHDM